LDSTRCCEPLLHWAANHGYCDTTVEYDICSSGAVSDAAPRAAEGVSTLVATGPSGSGRPLGGTVFEVDFADKLTNRIQKLRRRMKRNAG
jgi:hypothetical protein